MMKRLTEVFWANSSGLTRVGSAGAAPCQRSILIHVATARSLLGRGSYREFSAGGQKRDKEVVFVNTQFVSPQVSTANPWREAKDSVSGAVYWYNPQTSESTSIG